jgi:hypothetical protein
MSDKTSKITLIIPEPIIPKDITRDRAGGETHGIKEVLQRKLGKAEIDVDKLKKNFEETMNKINNILQNVSETVSNNWELEGISIGLSISAEGSIGIATAGVETSIDVKLSPKKRSRL